MKITIWVEHGSSLEPEYFCFKGYYRDEETAIAGLKEMVAKLNLHSVQNPDEHDCKLNEKGYCEHPSHKPVNEVFK